MALRLQNDELNLDPDHITVNLEDFQFVWLDAKFAQTTFSPHALRYRQLVLELNSAAQFFSNPLKCVDFIRTVKRERVFLIVSGLLAKETISNIHEYYSLSAVFIFCTDRENYTYLKERFSKVKDVFNNQESLLESIRTAMKQIQSEMHSINTFDSHNQRSWIDLSKNNAEFLWYQLLIKVLRTIPVNEQKKEEFLNKCQQYYRGNPTEMANIQRFRTEYRRSSAIRWYTRDTFLYRLVNKAFRTRDTDYLYPLRFFINDLHAELLSKKENLTDRNILTLYHGRAIPRSELRECQSSEGNLISINGFFSTSRQRDVACHFLASSLNSSSNTVDKVGVFFEISADPRKHVAFADIAEDSQFPNEKEVLFGPPATFMVDSTDFDNNQNLLTIRMTATDEGEYRLHHYMDLQLHDRRDYPPDIYFGRILFEKLGKIDRAEKYFQMILRVSHTNDEFTPMIYIQLGDLHSAQKHPKGAIKFYRKAMEYYYDQSSLDYTKIISCLLKIANECLNESKLLQQVEIIYMMAQ